jgi:PilZ domain
MHLRRENPMQSPAPERRTMRRFDMRLPASVRIAGNGLRDLMTETQNVSARGVFFYLDRPLAEGARIEVTMTFPPHVTLTEPVRVRFTARVVRVENSHSASSIGVAAMIEEYEFLRSNTASEFSSGMR